MEEKSIDQLRREAQELYQAKLQAYQQNKNVTVLEVEKPVNRPKPAATVAPKINIKASLPKISLDTVKDTIISSIPTELPKRSAGKNNWFVVSIFSFLVFVVIMELFVFS